MFIGRKEELLYLNKKYSSSQAEFVVLYGRRRIGKTELIKNFIENKNYIFYASSEVDDREQRKRISNVIKEKMNLSDMDVTFNTWDDVFLSLSKFSKDEKLVFVIDEFPYMVNGNKSIPSILQNIWDHNLKNENVMIILCGSSVSFMLNDVLGSNNPLYGRTTGVYKLDELNIEDIPLLFDTASDEEIVEIYSVLGGVPQYLLYFDKNSSLEENIKENILSKGSNLYDEVNLLMKQELREPAVYFTILEAIALGNTKLNEIHQKTEIEKTTLNAYINKLLKLDIIKREYPVTEKLKKRVNAQSGLYRLKTNYFKFYFRYLFPNTSLLEMNATDLLYNKIIKNDLNIYMSIVFEDICVKYLMNKNITGTLPFFLHDIGRWWYKQTEIDIVGFDKDNNFIFGECKWRNESISMQVLENLIAKTEEHFKKVSAKNYYLFSKSGFSDELLEYSKQYDHVTLISINDLFS
jgi:AAA+ ATPase superfamily predicted ATPase